MFGRFPLIFNEDRSYFIEISDRKERGVIMLNEMIMYATCPVCGRYHAYYPLEYWWCPLCGSDVEQRIDNLEKRIEILEQQLQEKENEDEEEIIEDDLI